MFFNNGSIRDRVRQCLEALQNCPEHQHWWPAYQGDHVTINELITEGIEKCSKRTLTPEEKEELRALIVNQLPQQL